MSCSAQSGRSWVCEPAEQGFSRRAREETRERAEDDGAPGVPRGGVNLLERMIEVRGVELCAETFGDPVDTTLAMELLRQPVAAGGNGSGLLLRS
jgi:hypothetical protein